MYNKVCRLNVFCTELYSKCTTVMCSARFVRDICFSKLCAVSWVQYCPFEVNGEFMVHSQAILTKINHFTDPNYILRSTD